MKAEISIAIIQFPGSNTERETISAVRRAGMKPVEFLWNGNREELRAFDGYIIVGGFSYEDRSRAGVIAAMDPIIETLKKENEKGKPLLGICNGAQILVESGIVPCLSNYRLGMALTDNKRVKNNHVVGTGYYNTWANLKLETEPKRTAFTNLMSGGEIIYVPFAHAEGRFLVPTELLHELITNGQTVFRYCDNNGTVEEDFPVNPNGSTYNLAAVSNTVGNALAIMPHPERTENGDKLFGSMKNYIETTTTSSSIKLQYNRPQYHVASYTPDPEIDELLIQLIITDNEALTVQNALRKNGIIVKVHKTMRWSIKSNREDKTMFYKELEESGELFNNNKERLIKREELPAGFHFYIRQKEDIDARKRHEVLSERLGIKGINKLEKGVLWTLSIPDNDQQLVKQIMDSHILFNPLSHECYRYE